MGCKCIKDNSSDIIHQIEKDISQKDINNENKIDNINYNINNKIESETKGLFLSDTSNFNNLLNENTYVKEIFDIINNIRTNPASFADEILNKKENIVYEKDKLVYKQKVKVALNKGEQSFDEAADICRNLSPLPKLEFEPLICVPFPEDEETAKNKEYLLEEVNKIKERENIKIDIFFKELVKLPEVSALLMVVDDNGKNTGKKRKSILNSNYKKIGINSRFYGRTFIAYFTFSE